ncbi:MAG: hypothetical protein J6328_06250 [Bacilli bacterium]|nr:hypothetical protein [Bacilli bacterium]
MNEEEKKSCSDFLARFGELLDVDTLQSISQMTSAPSIVYGYLYQRDEGATPGELAKECGCMPSRITAIINNLEKEHCLERFRREGDQRRVYVRLTPEGKKFFEAYYNRLLKVVSLLKEHFGAKRIEGFLADTKEALEFLRNTEVYKC